MPPSASRLLLLLPTTTYRTEAFIEAATKLGVELVCASERPSTFQELTPDSLVTLDFADPLGSAETIARFARTRPIDAVVPVDDPTTVVAAAISQRLGLKANSLPAVSAARDKHAMRRCLAAAGVPVPRFRLVRLADNPDDVAARVEYPCVLKPLLLSASRGVIRANDARRVRRRVPAHRGHPRRAGRGAAGRRSPRAARRRVRSRTRGRARRPAGGRHAARAGDLRQAGPARRPVLRGDDLRDAVAAAARPSRIASPR